MNNTMLYHNRLLNAIIAAEKQAKKFSDIWVKWVDEKNQLDTNTDAGKINLYNRQIAFVEGEKHEISSNISTLKYLLSAFERDFDIPEENRYFKNMVK